jgi:transcriptional regulator with XRE-family HTH domain
MEHKFQNVVRQCRTQQGMSMRRFADALNEKLVNTDISFATVSRWENIDKHYEPDMNFLFECFVTYTDWRMHFAVDSLKAIMPHVFDSGMVTFHLPKVE